jgi:tRNA-dihydrouridine synthase B
VRAAFRSRPRCASAGTPDHKVAPNLARALESVGIAAVTVHGRYTVQFFSGTADWDAIGEVVSAVSSIPVIGNGDVEEPQHAVELRRRSGCAGVMIGRGALRTPWIFRRTAALLATGVEPPEPSVNAKLRTIRRHLELLARYHPPEVALRTIRQRIAWYGKSLGHAKPLKEAIRLAQSLGDAATAIEATMDPSLDHATMVPAGYRFPSVVRGLAGRQTADQVSDA